MRICIERASGRLLEAQSGGTGDAHLEVLRANAVAAGFAADAVDVRYVEDGEYARLLEATRSAPTAKDLRSAAYPAIGDQLDALYWARHGDPKPLEQLDAQIAAVKAQFPVASEIKPG